MPQGFLATSTGGQAPKRDKREAIMDAAIEEFGKSGLDGANVDDIARAAGVAKGTIYLYFKSKHEIFDAVLAERWPGPLLDDMLPDMGGAQGLYELPLEVSLERLGRRFLDTIEDNISVFRLAIIEAQRYPQRAEHLFESAFLQTNRLVAAYLQTQSKAGLIAPLEAPLLTARCLQGMLLTYVLSQELLMGKKFTPIDKQVWVKEVVRLFVGGVRAPRADAGGHGEGTSATRETG